MKTHGSQPKVSMTIVYSLCTITEANRYEKASAIHAGGERHNDQTTESSCCNARNVPIPQRPKKEKHTNEKEMVIIEKMFDVN